MNEFIGLFALLLFLSLDGHLMLILAVARSFEWLPPLIATPGYGAKGGKW